MWDICSCLKDLIACLTGSTSPEGNAFYSGDLDKHSYGEYSYAQVMGEALMEDCIAVESRGNTVFVVVCDGHRGPDAALYISENLINHLHAALSRKELSGSVFKTAFDLTEFGFSQLVKREFGKKPEIAASGSGCLVGVIWKETLFVANLGDSRAVLGRLDSANKILAMELKDPNVNSSGGSTVLGDIYLKTPEFALDPKFSKFLPPDEPFLGLVLTSDPSGIFIRFHSNDQFIIFASDGLWEHLSNEEAVEIVHENPRLGIAKRLIVTALEKAAYKSQKSYDEVKQLHPKNRRAIHDDISVVVVFIDHPILNEVSSVRGTAGTSSSNIESSSSTGPPSTDGLISPVVTFSTIGSPSPSGVSSTAESISTATPPTFESTSTAGLFSTDGSLSSNVNDQPREAQITDAIIDT